MPDDSLEKLEKRLYQKGESFERRFEKPEFTYEKEEVQPQWNGAEEPKGGWKLTWDMRTFIIGVVVFFTGAIVLAGFYLFSGFGTVSNQNIAITITGPESAGGGDLVRWEVTIQNKNSVALENADLSFYYPPGSRPATGPASAGVPVERKSLGSVAAGGTAHETFSAFVYGAEGFEGEARAVVDYRTSGSNAIFEKSESVKIKISRAPVGVSVKMPSEVNAGRPVDIEVRYVSNAEAVLNNLTLELAYPDGFTFTKATPEPAEGITRWDVGDLAPGQEHVVKITGVFQGEDNAERSVQARVGVVDGSALNVYGETSVKLTLRRLFLELALALNGVVSPVLHGGDSVNVEVNWRNNLQDPVANASLEVSLVGAAVDERSISAEGGFYRGADHTVVWTPSSRTEFQQVAPGSSGKVQFSFRVRDAASLARDGVKNTTIELHAVMRPGSAVTSLPGVDVSGRADATAKVGTTLQFTSRGTYHSGLLASSGPLPPKVGQETIYTVVWSFANTTNDVVNADVRAGVPPYVRFTGMKVPSGEDIAFDAAKSEIVWHVSRIHAGAGTREPAKEVSFQIGLIPSVDQVGNSPVLLFGIAGEGQDESTSDRVRVTDSDLTTNLTSFDSAITQAQTKVVP